MADNAYTAFDPVFWSYHANIDRIFEIWLRANASGATFTANYPLHPFAGPRAGSFEFTDPRAFVYTSIGDLAKDSRGLGYDFAPPALPDFGTTAAATPIATAAAATASDELLVMFDDVRCTHASYAIDAFLDQPQAGPADVDPANPHYVGRVSRIGMGQADDKGRCITTGVRRMLDATAAARRLGLAHGAAAELTLLVTDLATGTAITDAERATLPGFHGRLAWTRSGWEPRVAAMAPAATASCCH